MWHCGAGPGWGGGEKGKNGLWGGKHWGEKHTPRQKKNFLRECVQGGSVDTAKEDATVGEEDVEGVRLFRKSKRRAIGVVRTGVKVAKKGLNTNQKSSSSGETTCTKGFFLGPSNPRARSGTGENGGNERGEKGPVIRKAVEKDVESPEFMPGKGV